MVNKNVTNSEILCYSYGLRSSEVLGLQWQSVDFNVDSILIRHTVSVGTKVVEMEIYPFFIGVQWHHELF